MKRLACVLALLWSSVAVASDQGSRFRVTIDPNGADDAATFIRQLASTARVVPSEVNGDTFVIAASDAALRVLRSDPRVLHVEPIETTATTTWSTGTYAYDAAGNIKSIGNDKFVYDGFGRLTSGMASGQKQSYTYDRFGNLRTITTGTTTARLGADPVTNRLSLSTISGQSMNAFGTYDAAGQLTQWNQSGGTFTYDGLGMVITSSGTPDGSNRRYIYTPNEERLVSIEVSGATETASEWTLRDTSGKALRRLERTNGNWAWRQDYIYLGSSLLAAEVDTSAKTLHFFPDHLGTPRLITGNGGAQTSFHTYFPFGEEATAPYQDGERMKFTGHERDASGLDYMHARYYSAGTGRFLSVDRGGFDPSQPQSWNRYSYVTNNPIAKVDPDGRDEKAVIARVRQVGTFLEELPAFPAMNAVGSVINDVADYGDAADDIQDFLLENRTVSDAELVSASVKGGMAAANLVTVALPVGKVKGQIHHIATDKAIKSGFTKQFEAIFAKAGMTLQDAANKLFLAGHSGRHSPAYHKYVIDVLSSAVRGLKGEKYEAALKRALSEIAKELKDNPEILKGAISK